MKKIIPLGKNVLIRLAEKEKVTESGIILPEKNNDEKSQQGEVVSIGENKEINSKIKPGSRVLFEKYEGSEIELEKEKFLIIKSKNILAVLE
jgi:chaperonin GroES